MGKVACVLTILHSQTTYIIPRETLKEYIHHMQEARLQRELVHSTGFYCYVGFFGRDSLCSLSVRLCVCVCDRAMSSTHRL